MAHPAVSAFLTAGRVFAVVIALTIVLASPARAVASSDAPVSAPAPAPTPPEDRARVRELLNAGRYRDAEVLARRLLREAETESPPDDPAIAGPLDDLAEALWRQFQGGTEETRAIAERAVSLRDRPGGPPLELATSLRNLAIVSNQSGDYERALALLERVLRIHESALGPDHELVARALDNLGAMLIYLGDYPAARDCLERAAVILKPKGGSARRPAANVLSNLGSVLGDMGDLAAARTALEESLRIREEVFGTGHPETALTIDNLGSALLLQGDRPAARPLLERGLNLREAALGQDHPHVALSLINLGRLAREEGDLRSALAYYERAAAIREKALGPDHMLVTASLTDVGQARLDLGDVSGAREVLERAAGIQARTLDPRHPGRAHTLAVLGQALRAAGEPAPALDDGLLAERIGREHFRAAARSLSEHEALAYEGVRERGLDLAITILADRPRPAVPHDAVARVWDSLVRSRALVLDEMAERRRSIAPGDSPSVAALRHALAAAKARLSRLLTLNPASSGAPAGRAEVEAAWKEAERAERALGKASESFRSKQVLSMQGLREVQKALPRGIALLAYVAFARFDASPGRPAVASIGAFVLPSGGAAPVFVPLGPAAPIEAAVGAWLEEAGRDPRLRADGEGDAAYRRAAGALRALVWDPLPGAVREAARLLVVPDGALHLVNLSTLPDAGGRYLAEIRPLIHHLSAERDLLRRDRVVAKREGLLAVGGIDFDAAPVVAVAARPGDGASAPSAPSSFRYRSAPAACPDISAMRFEPLPASVDELDDILRIWSADAGARPSSITRDLTGARADEGTVKRLAGTVRVLHLATHGFVATGDCARQNPLLVAGLALTGANRRTEVPKGTEGEDGILTAGEIAVLDLGGLQWAVLSACRTGLGAVRNGEGVLGLRRAFEIAGAGTLIMSLWSVEDEATRAWMRSLYAVRARGEDTATAVREASLEVLAAQRRLGRTTHPFFWGAFVATGDWR